VRIKRDFGAVLSETTLTPQRSIRQ
jgi:hypothetical protein